MEVKNKEDLIDSAIEQIKDDINDDDYTAIAELLEFLPEKYLLGFLRDDGEVQVADDDNIYVVHANGEVVVVLEEIKE